jgi:hypothetical protein
LVLAPLTSLQMYPPPSPGGGRRFAVPASSAISPFAHPEQQQPHPSVHRVPPTPPGTGFSWPARVSAPPILGANVTTQRGHPRFAHPADDRSNSSGTGTTTSTVAVPAPTLDASTVSDLIARLGSTQQQLDILTASLFHTTLAPQPLTAPRHAPGPLSGHHQPQTAPSRLFPRAPMDHPIDLLSAPLAVATPLSTPQRPVYQTPPATPLTPSEANLPTHPTDACGDLIFEFNAFIHGHSP